MTLDELEKRCNECEARFNDPNLPSLGTEPKFQLIVKGLRNGNRAWVMPGVMGEVISHVADNRTLVRVKVADVRKAIGRARVAIAKSSGGRQADES